MPPPLELPALERWMLAVLTHPGDIGAALRSEAASVFLPPGRLGDVLVPAAAHGGRPGLRPEERLEIYRRMYRLRLEESLADDYAALREALGDREFSRLALDYVTAHPSRSYTLVRLSDDLPEFLERRRHAPGWHVDLARLERARYQALERDEDPPLEEAALRGAPADGWPRTRLLPASSLQLLSFRYAVNAFYDAHRKGEPLHAPGRRRCHVAVVRRGDSVVRLEVETTAWPFLRALVAGEPLGSALASLPPHLTPRLFEWLRSWVAAGLFRAVA